MQTSLAAALLAVAVTAGAALGSDDVPAPEEPGAESAAEPRTFPASMIEAEPGPGETTVTVEAVDVLGVEGAPPPTPGLAGETTVTVEATDVLGATGELTEL